MSIETVFKGRSRPLSEEQAKLFLGCLISESRGVGMALSEAEWLFLSQIVRKRIEVMKLPIKFTDQALLAINALTDIPGGAVVIIVDALTRHEGETITVDKLAELYPFGFYDEGTFTDYVDNHLKPHRVKWAEVYCAKSGV